MARNIILVILFIVLYGGLILLGFSKAEDTVDRNGYGEFSDNGYYCESCDFEMEFKPEWIAMDGVAIESQYTRDELYDYFGEPGSYDLIAGFTSPKLYLECIRYKNFNMEKSCFTTTYLDRELDYCKENISLIGGTLRGNGTRMLNAQGNGAEIGAYYYDYTLDGEFYSELNCFVNCGRDTIWLCGYYSDQDGLDELLEFVETGIVFKSESTQNL